MSVGATFLNGTPNTLERCPTRVDFFVQTTGEAARRSRCAAALGGPVPRVYPSSQLARCRVFQCYRPWLLVNSECARYQHATCFRVRRDCGNQRVVRRPA
jgi:hypothetical protein